MKELIKEPCEDALWCIGQARPGKLGTGRQDIIRPEPDVWQQIHYGIPFRLAKGFAILRKIQRGVE